MEKTEQTIAKIDSFGGDMREVGQKVDNTFRIFPDKEAVDYSAKGKKFSKTELVKKPFVAKKKLFGKMEEYLGATIDRVGSLAKESEYVQGKTAVGKEKPVAATMVM